MDQDDIQFLKTRRIVIRGSVLSLFFILYSLRVDPLSMVNIRVIIRLLLTSCLHSLTGNV